VGDEPGEMGDALPAVDLGTGRRAVQVAASVEHTCAVLDDGQLKCWGWNEGLLGLGTIDFARGDEPGEMGDALPAINLGTGRSALRVAVGFYHTCALLDTQQLKCWGRNDGGVLGQGDDRARGSDAADMGDALPSIDLGR
jgi:alpha-tubulin suppressor-like RCC1 family protein